MSVTDGGSDREPGAVPAGSEQGQGPQEIGGVAGPGRAEAEARAEEIHAEVARTEARRAEEQAAEADEAVEEAERRQKAAHEAEESARRHAEEVRDDARDAVERVTSSPARGVTGTRTWGSADAGAPIVFGPFTAERPELLVAAAFVGGFLLAKIIRGMAS